MYFTATLDTSTKIITTVITLFFIGVAIGTKLLGDTEDIMILNIVSVGLIFIYGLSYALSPKGYEVSEDHFIIKRVFGGITLDRSKIQDILKIENQKLKQSIRIFGVGGLFGYFGKFWNKEFGTMSWYVTRLDRAIMIITTDNKKIVISPDETEKFIAQCTLRKK